MSCHPLSSHAMPRASRDSSTSCVIGPNSRRAASRAASVVIPRARFSSTRCSRCSRISSPSSRSAASPRTSARSRIRTMSASRILSPPVRQSPTAVTATPWPLYGSDNQRDGGGEPFPRRGFPVELFAAGPGELVVLRPPVLIRHAPLGFDPALVLEALQRGIQRALLHQQHVVGQLPDAPGDRPAVHRLERERFENEEIERPLHE